MDANTMRAEFLLRREGAGYKEVPYNDREIAAFLTRASRSLTKTRFDALKNRTQRGFEQAIRQDEIGSMLAAHKLYRRSEDEFVMGTDDNGAFHTSDLDVTVDGVESHACFVNLPDEMMYPISENCTLSKSGVTYRLVPVRPTNPAVYNDYIFNPYKNPADDLVWGIGWGSWTPSEDHNTPSVKYYTGVSTKDKSTEVLLDTNRSRMLLAGNGFVVEEYRLHYIKMVTPIVINVRVPSLQINCELPDFMHDEVVDLAVKFSLASEIPVANKYEVADKEVRESE